MTPSDAILDRIKKLMALADSAANEHEAALAGERMQTLLTEFNLTRAEVESKTEETRDDALTAKRERSQSDRGAMYRWQRDMMAAVARNNFCSHFVGRVFRAEDWGAHYRRIEIADSSRPSGKRWDEVKGVYAKGHVLVGRSENVAATLLMFDYLSTQIRRLCPHSTLADRADKYLWLDGCAETIVERLDRKRSEAEEAQRRRETQTPGLVLLSDLYANEEELNEDFRRGLAPGTTTKNRLEDEAEERAEKARIEAEEKRLLATGMHSDDAWHVARGYDPPSREPAQTTAGSKRKSTYVPRGRCAYAAEDREYRRRSSDAFKSGRAAGGKVGLGGAVKEGSGPKRIG
jgi:hypothetical protein